MPLRTLQAIRPAEALDAIRRLFANPDDTEQAFRVLRALDGGHLFRLYTRFSQNSIGRALLREKPSILAALRDRDALSAMPVGSLGRLYVQFSDEEGITPGGLVEASEDGERELLPPDILYLADRMRDTHDLWHLVTGCRTDLLGELALLAFTTVQTGFLGTGALATAGYLRTYAFPKQLGERGRRNVREAIRYARSASWLPVARWEELLPLPLADVRDKLAVVPMAGYEPVYVKELAA